MVMEAADKGYGTDFSERGELNDVAVDVVGCGCGGV
jgi:hypothetical protein